jgi:anti-sigma factor RsiW
MICDKETLVGYIYDELGVTERATFEEHLARCAACREEVDGLRATRAHLATWAPPEPDFGFPRFRVVRENEAPAPVRRFRLSPAWGLAAAAVLLLAVASAIANLEVKYGSDGLVVRTGWARSAPAAVPPVQPATEVTPVSAAQDWKADFQRLEQRLRSLEVSASSRPAASSQAVSAQARLSDQELLRQVRAIINQSEARQQRELALRVAQVVRESEAQRQTDLVRVQQGLQQMQGMTDAELIRHRDALNYLVRVAQQSR